MKGEKNKKGKPQIISPTRSI